MRAAKRQPIAPAPMIATLGVDDRKAIARSYTL
jgi:hypothetical protein